MWMDQEIILRKPDTEKQVLYDITHMWKNNNNTDELRKRSTNTENKLMVT